MIAMTGCITHVDIAPVIADEQTTASKELVMEFFQKCILDQDLAAADQYLRKDYIQHNPQIPNGLDGFVTYFTKLNGQLKSLNATIHGEIEHVIAQGDRVVVFVAFRIEGPISVKFRAADLFRVQNGMIAEHWDVRQGETLRDHQILMQN